jgi:hypothetical protein
MNPAMMSLLNPNITGQDLLARFPGFDPAQLQARITPQNLPGLGASLQPQVAPPHDKLGYPVGQKSPPLGQRGTPPVTPWESDPFLNFGFSPNRSGAGLPGGQFPIGQMGQNGQFQLPGGFNPQAGQFNLPGSQGGGLDPQRLMSILSMLGQGAGRAGQGVGQAAQGVARAAPAVVSGAAQLAKPVLQFNPIAAQAPASLGALLRGGPYAT